jgi:hypothetical protein
VRGGERWCRWHDPTAEGRRRHRAESARGGKAKAYNALAATAPLAESLNLDALDLATAGGVVALLAGSLRALAALPFDVRTAHAIAQTATAQRNVIETADLAERVAALEAALPTWPGTR